MNTQTLAAGRLPGLVSEQDGAGSLAAARPASLGTQPFPGARAAVSE